MAWSDANPFLEYAQKTDRFCGVIAYVSPFDNSVSQWRDLYSYFKLDLPDEFYMYRMWNGELSPKREVGRSILCQSRSFSHAKQVRSQSVAPIKPILQELNNLIYDNYYIVQVATTLALDTLRVPREAMPVKYNTQITSGDSIDKDTVFLHYYGSLSRISSIKDVEALIDKSLSKKILEVYA